MGFHVFRIFQYASLLLFLFSLLFTGCDSSQSNTAEKFYPSPIKLKLYYHHQKRAGKEHLTRSETFSCVWRASGNYLILKESGGQKLAQLWVHDSGNFGSFQLSGGLTSDEQEKAQMAFVILPPLNVEPNTTWRRIAKCGTAKLTLDFHAQR
ncbi:MAG: hypothetical protein ACI9HK_006202, partial [Pirellulaceae bacterium]